MLMELIVILQQNINTEIISYPKYKSYAMENDTCDIIKQDEIKSYSTCYSFNFLSKFFVAFSEGLTRRKTMIVR